MADASPQTAQNEADQALRAWLVTDCESQEGYALNNSKVQKGLDMPGRTVRMNVHTRALGR